MFPALHEKNCIFFVATYDVQQISEDSSGTLRKLNKKKQKVASLKDNIVHLCVREQWQQFHSSLAQSSTFPPTHCLWNE